MKKKALLVIIAAIAGVSSVAALWLSGFDFVGYLTAISGQSSIVCSKAFTVNNALPVIESCPYDNAALTKYAFSIDTSEVVSSDSNCVIEEDVDYKFYIGIDNTSFVNLVSNPSKIIHPGEHTIDILIDPHVNRCPVDNATFTVTGVVSEISNTTETFLLFDGSGCGAVNCNEELCMEECENRYAYCYSTNARCENYQPGSYWYCWCDATVFE